MQSASQYLEAAGCWRKISKLSEKDMLVEDVLNFYLIIRLQLPLQRLVYFNIYKTIIHIHI